MMFHTQYFTLFFLAIFAAYWALPSRKARHILLFIASLAFYMSWDIPLASLLLASALFSYFIGARVFESSGRLWLVIGVGANLAVLCFFKYADFGVSSANALLEAFGLTGDVGLLKITLPLGISFYTFHNISYIVDLHRRKITPYKSILEYGLYIIFFPQLIAGPLIRAKFFKKQLRRRIKLNFTYINQGVCLFAIGVFKKVVLADNAAVFANEVFDSPANYTSFLACVGAAAFSFQIYFDFSAYTDMARGVGYLLGFRFPDNFMRPYGALGLRDFWRRWHISLSTWLRDYLYISLGGSRHGPWRTRLNLMITMLLGGLWHGASWNFFIWGGIHGALLSVEQAASNRTILKTSSPMVNGLIALSTFGVVTFAWIFFRARTFDGAMDMLISIATLPSGSYFHQVGLFKIQNWLIGFVLPGLIVFGSYLKPLDKSMRSYPPAVSALIIITMILVTMVVGGGANEFIYFQF